LVRPARDGRSRSWCVPHVYPAQPRQRELPAIRPGDRQAGGSIVPPLGLQPGFDVCAQIHDPAAESEGGRAGPAVPPVTDR
jgi:hypothetical protein